MDCRWCVWSAEGTSILRYCVRSCVALTEANWSVEPGRNTARPTVREFIADLELCRRRRRDSRGTHLRLECASDKLSRRPVQRGSLIVLETARMAGYVRKNPAIGYWNPQCHVGRRLRLRIA